MNFALDAKKIKNDDNRFKIAGIMSGRLMPFSLQSERPFPFCLTMMIITYYRKKDNGKKFHGHSIEVQKYKRVCIIITM